jgi:hypothetical protein
MAEPPAAAPKPCCVCAAPNGKHCAKCKSRHYCSKACQLVDWHEGGHKAQCRKLAAEFQDRLLDSLMPEKKPKEAPAIVEDVLLADGSKAAARLSAVQVAKTADPGALSDDAASWRGTCAICLDVLPFENNKTTFYDCCCKRICTACSDKCRQHDERCPLCRATQFDSDPEFLRRLRKHVDKGNAEAQIVLGGKYFIGGMGLQQDLKRAIQLYEHAAAQGHAVAQDSLGACYARGHGVEVDYTTAALWFRRAAEQEYPDAQFNLGYAFYTGTGVAQSYEEAVRWYLLAAAQGQPGALYNLGVCHSNADGLPQDLDEALRLFKRAAAKGYAKAAAAVDTLEAHLAATQAA